MRSYQPSPFFVLDEVDAALDNTNVAKIANYIRTHASESFQFIVISLKGSLYERGQSLVGIYRDQEVNSSRTLTLDVSTFLGSRIPMLIASLAHAVRRVKIQLPLSHSLAIALISRSSCSLCLLYVFVLCELYRADPPKHYNN
jgi:hypothetical protein